LNIPGPEIPAKPTLNYFITGELFLCSTGKWARSSKKLVIEAHLYLFRSGIQNPKIMKPKTILLILALVGIVFSCIPSLYPLYREKDLLHNDQLVGRFGDPEDDDYYWEFRLLSEGTDQGLDGDWQSFQSGYTYRLTVMEDSVIEEFATHLIKLGEDYYIDFFPVNYTIEPDMLEMSMAPSHIFAKAEIESDWLLLHFFDPEWLVELIDDNKIKISYLDMGERYLLTAKTEDLQKFILKYANDSTTFMEVDTLLRQTKF
jgi:hypothetical protein